MHGSCCSSENEQECRPSGAGHCGEEYSHGGCGHGDPMDKVIGSWKSAFFEAKHQVQVELLKAKIQKAWGPKLDKAADAVLETVEAIFQSALTQGQAKAKLKEQLQAIFVEGRK